jgi:deoxyribose-phosphate aldolase
MDSAELERIVTEIGDRILARPRPATAPAARAQSAGACAECGGACAGICVPAARAMSAAGACRLTACGTLTRTDPAVAALIDHTILKPEAAAGEIRRVCREAREYCFASVCVNPYWVPLVAAELRGSPVKVCTVAGFPLGATPAEVKVFEAETAIRAGANEVDMVINVGALKSGGLAAVRNEIQAVAQACHNGGAQLKAIIETALLDDAEKIMACTLAKVAGADFVKTSTGFSKHGATAADIALMRRTVGPDLGVKASGGVRTLEDVKAMTAAGATRIGASASVKIVQETAG